VVEDNMLIGAKIALQLASFGYEVAGILPQGEEAIAYMKENIVDIILLDINLKEKTDGIETAKQIQKQFSVPVIYLTANADEATFNMAKITKPAAFISKPFKQVDLQRAIELTICRMAENQTGPVSALENSNNQHFILRDRIFIRSRDKMIKIMVPDILYIEADRNYSQVFTRQKEFLLSLTLKAIEEKLPADIFVRIHRSYIINILQVEEVAESHVIIGQKAIPMSSVLKDNLLRKIQTL
ncbi:MAG TPA: LytTR family transcriptional regulator DNA-binding domain-containing protein, partial [Hanamia sp.]|nr:LytTR family transcriptional regulator DNA-binding domain-containing protein [Hanamia sp.]